MKKSLLVLSILSVMAIVMGGVMFLIGASIVDYDIYALDRTEYKADVLTMENEIFAGKTSADIVKIEADIDDFKIEVNNGSEFYLSYVTADDNKLTTSFEEGVLKIKYDEEFKFNLRPFQGIKRLKYKYVMTVPEGIDLTLKSSNGKVTAKDAVFSDINITGSNSNINFDNVTANFITIKTSNLDADLTEVKADHLYIDSSNGDVNLGECAFNNIEIEGSNFDFRLSHSSVSGIVKFDCSNADIVTENSTVGTLSGETSNGGLLIKDSVFDNFDVGGSNLSVKTDGYVDCNNYKIRGSNLSVKIDILGSVEDFKRIDVNGSNKSFRIDGERQNGDYNGNGTKIFDAEGSNINVRINFVGNLQIQPYYEVA